MLGSARSPIQLTLVHGLCGYTEADERGDGAEALGIGNMFSDPAMFAKLAANPRTAKHLADVGFMQKVCVFSTLLRRTLQLTVSPSSSSSYRKIPN